MKYHIHDYCCFNLKQGEVSHLLGSCGVDGGLQSSKISYNMTKQDFNISAIHRLYNRYQPISDSYKIICGNVNKMEQNKDFHTLQNKLSMIVHVH